MQNADEYYCLTWHGTILTRDQTGMPFRHETLANGIPPTAARFNLHCTAAGSQIGVTARLLHSPATPGAPETADQLRFAVLSTGTGRAAFLHLGKNFLAAPEPHGHLHAFPRNGMFTEFVFVPQQELAYLLFIRNNQWLTSNGALINHGESGFRPGFIFTFGETDSDLRQGPCHSAAGPAMPADSSPHLTEITILRDGWKIAGQLRLFRPLIYYTAFGRREIFEQLRWSLHSLAEFGAYSGDVHVISDRPRSYIAQFIPAEMHPRLTVQHASGMDYWDYIFARFRLSQWPQAASFQPLLYVDTDIVFDRPVEPLLIGIARSPNICVVSEPFSKLSDAVSAGAPLFKAAGVETDESCGFNAGCQGFHNFAATQNYFRLTLHAAESYRASHPGGVSKFGDQPFANYVAYMTETMNTQLMDAAMRLSGPTLSAAPADRTGIVHFWPSSHATALGRVAEVKRDDMRAYIEAVAAANAPPPPPVKLHPEPPLAAVTR